MELREPGAAGRYVGCMTRSNKTLGRAVMLRALGQ